MTTITRLCVRKLKLIEMWVLASMTARGPGKLKGQYEDRILADLGGKTEGISISGAHQLCMLPYDEQRQGDVDNMIVKPATETMLKPDKVNKVVWH